MARDRSALDAFLEESGFVSARTSSGEATPGRTSDYARTPLLFEPEHSETKEIRASEKSVVVTISTRARDRHGDIIDPAGVRLDRFRRNPVVLYAHDYRGLPVAKSLWERVRHDTTGQPQMNTDERRLQAEEPIGVHLRSSVVSAPAVSLIAKPKFHLNTELSREVWALVQKGVLSAWSIGFIPEKWKPGPEGKGFTVTRWDLLEYSCVPVPANFEALTHELKARRITAPALVKSLAPLGLKEPDLVPQEVRSDDTATAKDAKIAKDAEDTKAEEAACPSCAEKDAEIEKLGAKDARADEPVVPCSAADIASAVSRAFERVLARSRGEGYV